MTALVDRHVAFVAALREAGVIVSVAESLDSVGAMETVGLADRDRLRAGLAATLVKRPVHRPVFDSLFDLYYPAVTGESVAPRDTSAPAPRDSGAASRGPLEDPRRDRARELLADYLHDGTADQLDVAVREAVAAFGAVAGGSAGGSTWSRHAVLTSMSAHTLLAGLLDRFLAGADRGGLAERRARTVIGERVDRFETAVGADVSRRLAERSGPEAVSRTSTPPSLDRVAFLGASRAELAALRREVEPLARRLAARLAQDQRRGSRGQLDFRATVRESLSTGGVPMATRHRPRRAVKTDLVVLCDLSESVSSFAHFTLLLVYALRQQFARVRAFGFVDEIDELTRFFRPGADILDTVTRLAAEADVVGLVGRTDYGGSLDLFARRFPDAVGPRSSLLVLGDARSNHGPLGLDALTTMANRARHAYWLNPERRRLWDTGDSRAAEYAAVVPMVECRNLAQLGGFVRDLTR